MGWMVSSREGPSVLRAWGQILNLLGSMRTSSERPRVGQGAWLHDLPGESLVRFGFLLGSSTEAPQSVKRGLRVSTWAALRGDGAESSVLSGCSSRGARSSQGPKLPGRCRSSRVPGPKTRNSPWSPARHGASTAGRRFREPMLVEGTRVTSGLLDGGSEELVEGLTRRIPTRVGRAGARSADRRCRSLARSAFSLG